VRGKPRDADKARGRMGEQRKGSHIDIRLLFAHILSCGKQMREAFLPVF
jgi:hypothetical protein